MSNGYCLNDKLSCGSMFAGKSVQVERISGVEGRNVQMPMQHYKSLCLAVMIWATHRQTAFHRLYYQLSWLSWWHTFSMFTKGQVWFPRNPNNNYKLLNGTLLRTMRDFNFRWAVSLSGFANMSTKITTRREFRLSLSFCWAKTLSNSAQWKWIPLSDFLITTVLHQLPI